MGEDERIFLEVLAFFLLIALYPVYLFWKGFDDDKYDWASTDRCGQCSFPIHWSDDDAGICIQCGGRNRRALKPTTSKPSSRKERD